MPLRMTQIIRRRIQITNRRLLSTIMAIGLLACSFLLAQSSFATGIGVIIDGQTVTFTTASGSPFLDSSNRTQVPFRQTMEAFGATVSWDQENQTAIAQKNGITVRVPIGKYYIYKGADFITNDTAALIKDGRTFLPIRKVLEAFGAKVGWNSTSNNVEVVANSAGTQTAEPTQTSAETTSGGYFDTRDLGKGLIHVTNNDGGKLKIMIEKDGAKYTYDQNSAGVRETYPLQLGNGIYKVSLLKNISGTSYRLVESKSVTLKLADPNSVFLTSIQTINWNIDSKAVQKAVELTKNAKTLQEKAKLLWGYMYQNNSYDYVKAATIYSGYVPVVDKTLEEKKGICYDFSSLFAAMLRSQGTPAKLIKGYAPDYASGYHAWNEAYDASLGKWVVIDTTYDLQIFARSKTPVMSKNSTDFNKLYEY